MDAHTQQGKPQAKQANKSKSNLVSAHYLETIKRKRRFPNKEGGKGEEETDLPAVNEVSPSTHPVNNAYATRLPSTTFPGQTHDCPPGSCRG